MKKKHLFFLVLLLGVMLYTGKCYADTSLDLTNVVLDQVNMGSEDATCSALGSFKDDLQSIFNAFKIIAPILTLVLSTFEYVTTILNKELENMKKTNKRFITRLVLVVVLYFIPVILNLLLGIIFPGSGTCVK